MRHKPLIPDNEVIITISSDCVQAEEAQIAQHLRAVGCCPLQLALPWMQAGFAGHLAVGEVLLLWDRIIGFDSLLPLPLLALAVLAFRRQV